MKKIFFIVLVSLHIQQIQAQLFINKATIEFEVKTNVKKTMGESPWAEMMKDNMPNFKTAYYNYTFANNKSFYKLTHFDELSKLPDWMKKDDEENEWLTDFNSGIAEIKKNVAGTAFNIKDSVHKIEWKLSNENRVIAGFNCRKAIGKIFDSVYVFVFYSEEIPISGGPCSINGLPGMILGMTIPRLYTSWIATKVDVLGIDENKLKKQPTKKTYTQKEYRGLLNDRAKEWGSGEEEKKWVSQFLWQAQL